MRNENFDSGCCANAELVKVGCLREIQTVPSPCPQNVGGRLNIESTQSNELAGARWETGASILCGGRQRKGAVPKLHCQTGCFQTT
jgi:hypothetical protein